MSAPATAALGGTVPMDGKSKGSVSVLGLVLLIPALGILLGAFAWPILGLMVKSVSTADGQGYTAANFAKVLVDPLGLRILVTSLQISAATTLICVVLGFPLAYQAARSGAAVRAIILSLVSFPLLTSAVVRTFGWQILMFPNGTIASTLRLLGWTGAPGLVASVTGVVIALAEIGLPLMVLTLVGVIRSIDESLEEAALDLGDSPLFVWWRVTLPLSMNGLLGGGLLVFSFSMSAYATPKLIGQSRVLTLAQAIYDQSIVLLHYEISAAFSVVLLAITLSVSVLSARLMKRARDA